MWRAAWWTFRRISGMQFWMVRRFTPAGLFLIGAAILAAVFGVDTNQSLAYKVFTSLAALLAVAGVASRFTRARFEVRRELPRAVVAGEEFEYRVRLRNLGDRGIEGAALIEDTGDPRPGLEAFRAQARMPTYVAWWRIVERNRIAQIRPPIVPALGAGDEAQLRVTGRTYQRGRLHFAGCTVALSDPLGLVRRSFDIAAEGQLLVLPRRYKLPHFTLPGARRYQHGGVALASSVGDSEESLGLRDYRPGDPIQRIHWKSFAKRGEPVVREYQDEFFERHALILDTFCASAGERAFEEAVAVAASLAQTIDTHECLLDLMFVGAEAYTFTAGRGQLQPESLLAVLAGVLPCADRPFRVLHDAVRARRAAMSGALCVLLAWDAARRDFVDEMRATGLALRVLVVSEAPVADPPAWLTVLHPDRMQQGLATL